MQLGGDGEAVRVTVYCKDPDSQGSDDCETFYKADWTSGEASRMSWMVQGKRHGGEVAAQLVSLADDETFCEISDPTAELFVRMFVKERYGIDLPAAAD